MNINFVKFEEQYANRMSEIIVSNLRENGKKEYNPWELKQLSSEYEPEHIVEQSKWKHTIMALDNQTVIGTGGFAKTPKKTAIGEYFMLSVFVDRSYQGKNIGSKLVAYIEEKVKQLGGNRMKVVVSPCEESFYKKLGYVEIEQRKEWIENQRLIMEKSLS